MKLTAKDLLSLGIIDEIINEPLGGAHRDPNLIAEDIKSALIENLKFFRGMSKSEIFDHRKNKFLKIGRDKGFAKSSQTDAGLGYKEPKYAKIVKNLNKNKFIYAGVIVAAITAIIIFI